MTATADPRQTEIPLSRPDCGKCETLPDDAIHGTVLNIDQIRLIMFTSAERVLFPLPTALLFVCQQDCTKPPRTIRLKEEPFTFCGKSRHFH